MRFSIFLASGWFLTLVPPAAAQSCERASTLAFAASSYGTDQVAGLLDEGIGVDCISTGKTPLMHAARWNKPANVALLLQRGADALLESTDDGWTALEYAQSAGYAEVTKILAAHLGIADPLAPRRRAGPPAAATPPAAPRQAQPAPAPAPQAQPTPAPGGEPARPAAGAPATRWAPFGTYREGDRVQFWTSVGWRTGTVTEVGPAGSYGIRNTGSAYDRKYRISDDRFPGAGDWYDWGVVTSVTRQSHWTGFFVGDWALGEVMAVNTRVEGRTETTEYSYASASEALRVSADGTYQWKQLGGPVIRGRWSPVPDGPGIVLHRGAQGRDWTMQNQTNAIEENIRSIETARLFSPNVMSTAAKRPLAQRAR